MLWSWFKRRRERKKPPVVTPHEGGHLVTTPYGKWWCSPSGSAWYKYPSKQPAPQEMIIPLSLILIQYMTTGRFTSADQ